jgi:hypothetical protein
LGLLRRAAWFARTLFIGSYLIRYSMIMNLTDIEKMAPAQALKAIEEQIKKGANPERFKAVLDRILGTEEPAADAELDAAWEKGHRP